MPDYPDPCQFEMLTVTNAVKTLTAAKYQPVSGASASHQVFHTLISVDGADLRYTLDGTTPVGGSVGHVLTNGDSMIINGKEAAMMFKGIRNAGTPLLLAATYFF